MASTVEAHDAPHENKTTVTVVYNGRTAALEYQPHQAVQALLRHALHAFGVAAAEGEMALFNLAGGELDSHVSVEQAGVRPGDELVLRQRVVRGGH
jgi:hypothetical protein